MLRLKMPGVDDLTPEQDRILRLPDEGRYFVGGPPGTGKTLLALLRSHAMSARANRPNIIMYNRVLKSYCLQWLKSRNLRLNVDTYNAWFCTHYCRTYLERPPTSTDVAGKAQKYRYDWKQIEDIVAAQPPEQKATPVLVDEGQDLPRAFYQYLGLHFANIMVFADENQVLNENQNSTKENIWAELDIPPENRYLLTTNHRNTLEIARVAQYFYAGTDAGIPVLPTRRGRVPPYVIEYVDLEYFVTRIIRHAGKYPHDLIAVVTHNNKSQDAIKEKLEPACRNTRTRFECYRSENKTTVNFDRAGILLLNIQSVKGLEFDCVLIADLHEHYICSNSVAHKMRLYVATSRATDRLFVLYRRTGNCPLLAFLPGKDIVERYTLNDQGTPS